MATNLVNGKIYIGKTSGKLLDRVKKHYESAIYTYNKTPIAYAIAKYGQVNFKFETLEEIQDKDSLGEREYHWIKYYNSTNSDIGYNVRSGKPTDTGKFKNSSKYIGVTKVYNKYYRLDFHFHNHYISKTFLDEKLAASFYDKLSFYFRGIGYKNINFPDLLSSYSLELIKEDIKFLIEEKRKYKGVSKSKNKWRVSIKFKYKSINTRPFDSIEEAAKTYDKISLFLRGPDYFYLNFPESREYYLKENLALFYKQVTTLRKNYSSVKGVGWHKNSKKWYARYKSNIHLGMYSSENEAISAINNYTKTNE